MSKSLLVLFLVLAMPAAATAQGNDTLPTPCDVALMKASDLTSWMELNVTWKLFPECDDGAVADGYSEFVVHTLARRWRTLPEAMELMEENPKFRAFVLGHIDATTDPDDLSKVIVNATRCKKGNADLCREISKRAQAALDDIRNPHRP